VLLRNTRTSQPPQLVEIDRANPLGKDIAFACLPTGSAPALAGSVALGNGPRGKHWLFPNATSTTATVNFGAAAAVDVLSQSPGWAMFVFNPGDSAQWSGSANFIANKSDANVTTGWTLYHSYFGVVTLKFVNASANKSVVTTSGAITSQKWCVLIYDHGGSTTAADGSRIFVDGVDRTSSSGTGSGAHPTDAALPLQLGLGPYGAVNSSVGQFALAAFGRKRLSAQEIAALTANPWQIFAPTSRKIWVPAIAGGGYTLTAASGSYTLSGQSATITKTRIVSAASGSYSYSGQSATILKTRIVAADQGSYSYTGQAATVLKTRNVSAAAGNYAYAGQAASILKGWVLTAANGSYSVAGQAATITYTPAAGSYVLNAAAGSYALSGQAATILKSKVITANAGAYSLAGVDATITYSGAASTGGGSYDEPRPKRRRHIIEVDGRLLEFGSKAAAIRYLDSIKPDIADKPDDAPDDIQPVISNKPKKPLPAPKLDIPLAQIEVSAPNTKALEQFKAQLRALEYQAILKAYEDWQDEQDIEILLMAM